MSKNTIPPNKPIRPYVPNPNIQERDTRPFTTAVVPPGSAFGHTADHLPAPVFDTNTGEPLPGVTIFPTT